MHTVSAAESSKLSRPTIPLPSRTDQLKKLQNTPEYDVLVIGGGVTGSGIALDAVSRGTQFRCAHSPSIFTYLLFFWITAIVCFEGLKTALVELDDFSSGTSSRSTKLIHGGVRYLQKAILKLDLEQYKMVREALSERANLLQIAPHLSYPLPIMLPVYK